jgi:hypothetical protein
MLSASHHSTKRRRWPAALAALAIASAGTLGVSQARAEPVTVGVFLSSIASVYGGMLSKLNLLKKPNDPAAAAAVTIVAEIRRSEQNILNQLQKAAFIEQQNGVISYSAKVKTVLDRYYDMASLPANHGQLPILRNATQVTSEETLTFFAETARTHSDIELSYQLAPAFNMLLAAHLNILKMAGEIKASEAFTVNFYTTQLRRGLETNYLMVGGREQACGGLTYPPTRGTYFIGKRLDGVQGSLVEPYKTNTYKQSTLYKRKFSNAWYNLRSDSGFTYSCNPGTRQCIVPSGVGAVTGLQSCDNPTSSSVKPILASCLSRADNFVSQKFNADPTVEAIRGSMRNMMTVGLASGVPGAGGFPATSVALGALFDPSVVNAPCGKNPQTGKPAGREYLIRP